MSELYGTVVLPERRAAFTTIGLEALAARRDGMLAVASVRRALVTSLGLNVVAAAEAVSLFDAWSRTRVNGEAARGGRWIL